MIQKYDSSGVEPHFDAAFVSTKYPALQAVQSSSLCVLQFAMAVSDGLVTIHH
jgi:hypothetical protein